MIKKEAAEKIKEVVSTEIEHIKQELSQPQIGLSSDIKLLGALLKFLRQTKSMTLLMLCRQIEKIEIEQGVAVVYSEDLGIKELVMNEKYKSELDSFFKSQGLSFRLNEKEQSVSAEDVLNQMLGGKLVVK